MLSCLSGESVSDCRLGGFDEASITAPLPSSPVVKGLRRDLASKHHPEESTSFL
jgi:hypothetical protein